MSIGEMFWILATLGFVLTLLGVALKLLRRFTPTSSTRDGLRMEVVQRLALGPKQGIAVVRVGERMVAVSLGEGGIHRLFELEPSELASSVRPAELAPTRKSGVDFRSAFHSAMKTAGLATGLLLALQIGTPTPARAQATPPTSTNPTAPPASPAASAALVQPKGGAIAPLSAAPAKKTSATSGKTATNAASAKTATNAATASTTSSAPGASIPQLDMHMGSTDGGLHLSGNVGAVVMLGMMTLLPSLILMMTGFTRIFIVLGFLRQALGTASTPPTQLIAALALILTGFVMAPTLTAVNRDALQPWLDGKIDQSQMLDVGARPFRTFMLKQTRRQDLDAFIRISKAAPPATVDDVPMLTLTSAFVASELRTAFQIGFALFLPFIIIDIAVASVLMSMGMFMLPPSMISLPFKLLLFVLVDGWALVMQSLVQSFR